MAMSVATAICALKNKYEGSRAEDSTRKGLSERRRNLTKHKEHLQCVFTWFAMLDSESAMVLYLKMHDAS